MSIVIILCVLVLSHVDIVDEHMYNHTSQPIIKNVFLALCHFTFTSQALEDIYMILGWMDYT